MQSHAQWPKTETSKAEFYCLAKRRKLEGYLIPQLFLVKSILELQVLLLRNPGWYREEP